MDEETIRRIAREEAKRAVQETMREIAAGIYEEALDIVLAPDTD
jgi:hypothetical protein